MQAVEALLRRHIGLDAASIGSSLIERTIRLRMKQRGLKRVEDYRDLLDSSRQELKELIEAVVVTETWFFRDREPFNAFIRLALEEWLPGRPSGVLRVLSVPCSSGEEPYSLAMALFDARVPGNRFEIDAADVSTNALIRARRALYGKNSFRGRDLAFRNRHFQLTREGYVLSPQVRRAVKFHCENVLDDHFLESRPPYDFIFCRNLLIYFDRTTQILALAKLHRLLAADGVLFVGAAEMPLVVESGFGNAGLPMAFACRKVNPDAARRPDPPRPRPIIITAPQIAAALNGAEPPAAPSRRRPATSPSELESARKLADAGHLDEAAAICRAHLDREGPSAQAFYLLGLVKDARNDPAAITCYRKALYLEPDHYEALVHIAAALEKSGDAAAARPYKRRAGRAQPAS
jgi:chemotaxis protein methyltransferase WspC